MILSTTQTFQMQHSLYQVISYADIRVETHLYFNNTWEVFITNDSFEILRFNRTLTALDEEQLFQYSTLIDTKVLQYIIDQHYALENLLCYYRISP
ncbi:MAG: hypothetical protein Lm2023SU_18980 [Serratia ureilytica]